MHPTIHFTTAFLVALAAASPVPGNVNVPISDAEWTALRSDGLKAREAQSTVNQPISDAEWQALKDAGLKRRDNGDGSSIVARDNVMNCGPHVTGKGGSNGHGKWVPVARFTKLADNFCKGFRNPSSPLLRSFRYAGLLTAVVMD